MVEKTLDREVNIEQHESYEKRMSTRVIISNSCSTSGTRRVTIKGRERSIM